MHQALSALFTSDFQHELLDNPEASSQFGQHDIDWPSPLQRVNPGKWCRSLCPWTLCSPFVSLQQLFAPALTSSVVISHLPACKEKGKGMTLILD
jgi:hypothetical protein